ncbi:hypothetical protein [Streptomyces sp. NPDC053720]|uniref:hypothetical protein n=1 Tax=Streptomyces sp. NPDC053720 TaxID=3154855 RepID=UPI0034480AB6
MLLAKSGAMAGSEALDQARREGQFTAVHEAFWAAAKIADGDTEGTKQLVHVLLLRQHRHREHRDVVAGTRSALAVGAHTADVVALEAGKAAESDGRSPTVTVTGLAPALPGPEPSEVVSLSAHRAVRLPTDQPPLPALERWDQLLNQSSKDVP